MNLKKFIIPATEIWCVGFIVLIISLVGISPVTLVFTSAVTALLMIPIVR